MEYEPTWIDYAIAILVLSGWATIPFAHWQVHRINKKHDRLAEERRQKVLGTLTRQQTNRHR